MTFEKSSLCEGHEKAFHTEKAATERVAEYLRVTLGKDWIVIIWGLFCVILYQMKSFLAERKSKQKLESQISFPQEVYAKLKMDLLISASRV